MSTRIATIFITISLFTLVGCAGHMDVRHYTSAQVTVHNADNGAPDRALTPTQVTALSNWIDTRNVWSGMSANIPDNPALEIQLQDAGGQTSSIDVYTREDGSATAYLYQGHRVAPLRSPLSAADLVALKAAINQQ